MNIEPKPRPIKKKRGMVTSETMEREVKRFIQCFTVRPSRINRPCDSQREVRSVFWGNPA